MRLRFNEKVKLIRWLRKNKNDINKLTHQQIADKYTKEFGIKVSKSSVGNFIRDIGIKRKRIPRKVYQFNSKNKTKERKMVVVNLLYKISKDLGVELSENEEAILSHYESGLKNTKNL